jgi:hypothetical protein
MDPIPIDCLEVGTGMPSFSNTNTFDPSPINCLEVGTGKPYCPSPLSSREEVDERHQPSYSSMCLLASTFASANCSIEDSSSFPFSSDPSFDMTRERSMGLFCEQSSVQPRKRPHAREVSEHQHASIGCMIQRGRPRNDVDRFNRKDSELDNCNKEHCPRSQDSQPDQCQQPGMEAYSIGSGDPCATPESPT